MAQMMLNAATPDGPSRFPIGPGSPDPAGNTAFTTAIGAQTSIVVDATRATGGLSLSVLADTDSTSTAQWEMSPSPSGPFAVLPGTNVVTNAKANGSATNQLNQSITWLKSGFIRLNVTANTGGGPLRGVVLGWDASGAPRL